MPYFVEGEELDVGPQYLLTETPHQPWFYFSSNLLATYTSNPTLVEDGAKDSSLTIWTNHLKFTPPISFDIFGGQIQSVLGIQHQSFRYGMIGDSEEIINGIPVDAFDFDAFTVYGEDVWTKGDWAVRLGLQYQSLTASSEGEFYSEITPYWIVSKRFTLNPDQVFFVEYTGWYRFTETESGGILPDDYNDRTDHRIALLYRQSIFDPNFIIEPRVSLRYSHYTENGRDRDDYYTTIALRGTYYFSKYVSVRMEMAYEQLSTSETFSSDYDVFDLGLGATLQFSF